MRLLLDQNLSRMLVCRLADEYRGSVHFAEIGLDTASDRDIWEYEGEHGYVIVSNYSGFRQLALLFGPQPHVGRLLGGMRLFGSEGGMKVLVEIPGAVQGLCESDGV